MTEILGLHLEHVRAVRSSEFCASVARSRVDHERFDRLVCPLPSDPLEAAAQVVAAVFHWDDDRDQRRSDADRWPARGSRTRMPREKGIVRSGERNDGRTREQDGRCAQQGEQRRVGSVHTGLAEKEYKAPFADARGLQPRPG